MSSGMSGDPESSNPFELLSDDPILHICSFLTGADLLNLSEVDKNFKRIVTESTETISKIPLVLNFEKNQDLDLDFAIKLAQTRRFTALKLNSESSVNRLTDANAKVKLISLLEMLSCSVDDLSVWASDKISQEFLSSVIAVFLPKLKKCKLENIWFDAEAAPTIEEISPQSNFNRPLESLELIETHAAKILKLFSGCNQLKTFCNEFPSGAYNATTEDFVHINKYLVTQDRLEKLIVEGEGLAWDRLTCFKLKELTVSPLSDNGEKLAASKFLKKLPNLAKLDLSVAYQPSRPLMNEICGLPKLEKLKIQTWEDGDEDEDSLEGLVNQTVKELIIEDCTNMTGKLLKIFLGVDSVHLSVRNKILADGQESLDTPVLDLSDVSFETIMKIELSEDYSCYKFVVKFNPIDLPTNVEQFESAVMEFAGEFPEKIVGIEIGHESWRNSGAFRLSNSFCEELVNLLPNLVKLEVFNIADRGRFIAFLGENESRLNLKEVKLHEPNGVGEPKQKKMKIEVD